MKQFIATGILALLLLSGCAQEQKQMAYIGADSAKKLALEAAGVSAGDVQFSSTDMGTRNGMDYYEIQFTCGSNSYCYDIEAMTGVIIDSQTPDAASPETSAITPPQDSSHVTAYEGQSGNAAVPAAAGTVQNNRPGTQSITVEEAKAIALVHAGLTADQVTFVKSGLDWDDGRQIYELEFYTSDYTEYDYEIDPYTSQILSYDYEAESFVPPSSTESGPISAEQAKQIALAQVPGASESHIWEFETDYDDGRLEYEGKIFYNKMEYEFEIDGYSGAIRSWEAEPIFD